MLLKSGQAAEVGLHHHVPGQHPLLKDSREGDLEQYGRVYK